MNPKDQTRAFICLTFPSEIIKELSNVQDSLSKYSFTGKLTELENLHLTLKFLGEISKEQLEKVNSLLETISFPEFKAHLLNTGIFSVRGNPSIVWIKIASPELFELQKLIDKTLSPLFTEEKRFMSHLTIARIKYVKDKSEFKAYVTHIKPKRLEFPVTSFRLMSSELKPLGPTYTLLKEYKLK